MNRQKILDKTKVIRQKQGALKFESRGNNFFLFNWKDNMMEIYLNNKRIFVIDLMGDLK